MIRRPLLAATALVAALALTSCSTFTDNANAARVGDVELSADSLAALVTSTDATGASDDGILDAAIARAAITQWVRVVVLETETGVPSDQAASVENLDSRLDTALAALASGNLDVAQEFYDAGPASSGVICLGVIPVASADDTAPLLDALSSGTSFADAAAQFSIDQGLADSGGVVTTADGAECFPLDQIDPQLGGQIAVNAVGAPFVVSLPTLDAVMVVRPFDTLSDEAQADVALTANGATVLPELVGQADVQVDSRYGYWDAVTAEVLALGS
ncbi:MAG: hypothetical protein WD023_01590 [Ilumatobacteraceae bacterium]